MSVIVKGGSGGKNYGANVWRRLTTKPSAKTTITIKSISASSQKIDLQLNSSNSNVPLSDLTRDDLVGLKIKGTKSGLYDYVFTLMANGVVSKDYLNDGSDPTYTANFTYNSSTGIVTIKSNFSFGFDEDEYNRNWTAYSDVTVTTSENPIDYIVNDDASAYDSNKFNEDGYYYELLGSITSANVMSLSANAIETVQSDYREQIVEEVSQS